MFDTIEYFFKRMMAMQLFGLDNMTEPRIQASNV